MAFEIAKWWFVDYECTLDAKRPGGRLCHRVKVEMTDGSELLCTLVHQAIMLFKDRCMNFKESGFEADHFMAQQEETKAAAAPLAAPSASRGVPSITPSAMQQVAIDAWMLELQRLADVHLLIRAEWVKMSGENNAVMAASFAILTKALAENQAERQAVLAKLGL